MTREIITTDEAIRRSKGRGRTEEEAMANFDKMVEEAEAEYGSQVPSLMIHKRGRPIGLPEPWQTLALKVGGVEELAEKLGVASRTIRHWAHGNHKMNGSAKILYNQLLQENQIPVLAPFDS